MSTVEISAIRLVVAISIGLLTGAERERRKGTQRGAAGVRTFALAAFAGALSRYLQGGSLLVVVAGAAVLFSASSEPSQTNEALSGRAFDLRLAIPFAGTISVFLFVCGLLNQWYGSRGVLLGAAFSGFADTHATAISIASLVSAGKMTPESAVGPVVVGFTTNTLTKAVVAFTAGGAHFALRILPGLIAAVLAALAGMWLGKC